MSLKERRKKTRDAYSPFGALDRPASGPQQALEAEHLGLGAKLFIAALLSYALGLALGWLCLH